MHPQLRPTNGRRTHVITGKANFSILVYFRCQTASYSATDTSEEFSSVNVYLSNNHTQTHNDILVDVDNPDVQYITKHGTEFMYLPKKKKNTFPKLYPILPFHQCPT